MSASQRCVLIVDDEAEDRNFLTEVLSSHWKIIAASDGNEAIALATSQQPDVVLLDMVMPGLDGLETCRNLRMNEETRSISIIFLTGVGDQEKRIHAFDLGADDFISKPFKIKELVARIQSKMRRIQEREKDQATLKCGNLQALLESMEVRIEERTIRLSVLEFNLLRFFLENQEQILTRERILAAVWKDCVVTDRTVDTHMASLRKKLKGFSGSISTIYGAGYILRGRPEA